MSASTPRDDKADHPPSCQHMSIQLPPHQSKPLRQRGSQPDSHTLFRIVDPHRNAPLHRGRISPAAQCFIPCSSHNSTLLFWSRGGGPQASETGRIISGKKARSRVAFRTFAQSRVEPQKWLRNYPAKNTPMAPGAGATPSPPRRNNRASCRPTSRSRAPATATARACRSPSARRLRAMRSARRA